MPTAFSMFELRESRVGGIEEDGDDGLDWPVTGVCLWKRWEEMRRAGGEDGDPRLTYLQYSAGAAVTCSHE